MSVRKRGYRYAGLAATLVLGAVAAGCGSSSSSSSGARSSGSGASGSSSSASSGGVAEAQKLIAQFQQQPQQTEVTTAITTPLLAGLRSDREGLH
jgi:hypothetical protein